MIELGKGHIFWLKVAIGGTGTFPPHVEAPPPLLPPHFITTPELPDTGKSLISVTRGMREDCDIMAAAPGRLVPVNLWGGAWEGHWSILWTAPMLVEREGGCVCANL